MRRLLGRGAVFAWVLVYLFTINTPISIMLIPVLGIFWVATATFAVVSLWGITFYLLLRKDDDLQKVKDLLKKLRGENGGIKGRILRRFPKLEDEVVLPIFWIFGGFVIFGALGGVPIVMLTYPEKNLHKVLLVILAGCAINVVVWVVLVYGPLLLAAWRFISALFAG